jgi:hypothetical protein
MKSGTVYVLVNGLDLSSNTDQTSSSNTDFYIDSSQKQVRINKLGTSGVGMNILLGDSILIGYQREVI